MFEIIAGDLSEETVYVEYPQPHFVYPEGELKHPFLSGLLGLKDKRKKVEIPFNNITEYEKLSDGLVLFCSWILT